MVLFQEKDSVFAFAKLHDSLVEKFLQLIKAALNGNSGPADNVKQYQPQYWPLRNAVNDLLSLEPQIARSHSSASFLTLL